MTHILVDTDFGFGVSLARYFLQIDSLYITLKRGFKNRLIQQFCLYQCQSVSRPPVTCSSGIVLKKCDRKCGSTNLCHTSIININNILLGYRSESLHYHNMSLQIR